MAGCMWLNGERWRIAGISEKDMKTSWVVNQMSSNAYQVALNLADPDEYVIKDNHVVESL